MIPISPSPILLHILLICIVFSINHIPKPKGIEGALQHKIPTYSAKTSTTYFIWALLHHQCTTELQHVFTGRKTRPTFWLRDAIVHLASESQELKWLRAAVVLKTFPKSHCTVCTAHNSLCCLHKQKLHLPQITCLYPFRQEATRDKLYISISSYLKQHVYYFQNTIWMNFMSQHLTYFSQCSPDSQGRHPGSLVRDLISLLILHMLKQQPGRELNKREQLLH